jgi:hypothetical protein
VSAAGWSWRCEDAGGAVIDIPAGEGFASRGDAESWLGEHWPSIAALGARRAQLIGGSTAIGRLVALPDPAPPP